LSYEDIKYLFKKFLIRGKHFSILRKRENKIFEEEKECYIEIPNESVRRIIRVYSKIISEHVAEVFPLYLSSSTDRLFVINKDFYALVVSFLNFIEFIREHDISLEKVLFYLEKIQLAEHLSNKEYRKPASIILKQIIAEKL